MVEPLSSMALPDAQAAGSSLVEPLSPMALPDAQAAASEVFSAAFLNGHSVFKRRSIGDNRSTIPAAAAFHGRAIVPNGSARRTSGGVCGFLGCFSQRPLCLQAPIDWGQSIYHPSGGVFHGRAIVPNGSTRRASGGVFGFLGYGNVLKDLLQSQGQS